MSKAKLPLVELVSEGLSLVLCTGQSKRMREIEEALSSAKLACASTRWLKTGPAISLADEWMKARAHNQIEDQALVVLAQIPLMTHGYRLPFHRIIWMDVRPAVTNPLYATYAQACSRGGPDVPVIHHTGVLS